MKTKQELHNEIEKLKARINELENQSNDSNSTDTELSECDINKAAITNAMESIAIFDKNGKYIFLNNTSAKLLGGKTKDFIGKTLHQTLPKDLADKYLASINEVINTKKEHSKETILKTANGTLYFIANTHPIKKNNEIKYIISTSINITKQKEAEFAKQKSAEVLKTILDNINAGIYVVDIETYEIIFANKYFTNLLGNIEGKICWKTLQKNQSAPCKFCNNEKLFDKKGNSTGVINWEFKNTITNKDYYLSDIGLNWTNNKKVRLEIATDITEFKKAEKKLQQSEENLKNIFNSSVNLIYIQDKNGVIIDINKNVEKIDGYSREEIIGQTPKMFSATNKNNNINIEEVTKKAFKGENQQFVFWGKQKNGKVIPKLIKLSKGEYSGKDVVFAFATDISKQIENEQKLIKSNEQLEMAILGSNAGFWDWNIEKQNIVYSEKWAKLLGYNIQELENNPNKWNNLLHHDDKTFVLKALKKHLKNKTNIFKVEHRLKTKSGNWKWFLTTGKVTKRDKNKKALRIVGTHIDIDERKKATQNLKKSKKELKESIITKDTLFSIIAHDLRSPFNSILGLSDLLVERIDNYSKERIVTISKAINQSGTETFKLLNNLLEWSRAQIGSIELNKQIIMISDLVKESSTVFESSLEQKNINLNLNINDNHYAYFDKQTISTVLRNIISNAIKFTPKDGSITISSYMKNNTAEICIKDNGLGMTDKQKNALFKISNNKSTPGTNNEQGSGLGLIICKDFTKLNNGEILFDSTLGQGSKFIIQLPSTK
ncbi:MAG: PAS domain S-box protein [Bacteroidota bacterium]|nr:PAS domain S-box protein [Bacteroidota bacterium]